MTLCKYFVIKWGAEGGKIFSTDDRALKTEL